MQTITAVDWQAPYEVRIAALHAAGIALWDVVASCKRQGSLDSNIQRDTITINPFAEFFNQYPQLRCVGLNGGKAFNLFYRHVVKKALLPKYVNYTALPSSSPAYTRPITDKITDWQSHLKPYL